ncbi:semaphorin-1A-like isoform X2 [Daktulosphaira vitifoliae]|uniref:semaphorin-1A-like isoform X2 n=1 Tax=Daktulosphaira vitifoliae TaxID=58002 RepID=UPI0021A9A22A|nr:semaphorin-1A-like isoform X2 [Daktulosphaira vitifoliae]
MSLKRWLGATMTNTAIVIYVTALLITIIGWLPSSEAGWQDNVRPKISAIRSKLKQKEIDLSNYYKYLRKVSEHSKIFSGNNTHTDYFKTLLRDGNNILVGARNMMYNLSLPDLTENQRLEWHSTDVDYKLCLVKGKDEDNCQNYIRVLAKTSSGQLLICGTNSYKPLCRDYSIESGSYSLEKESPGQAVCPYDPKHNSTYVYVDGNLFSATVADFSSMDPIIYKGQLQTEQYDSLSLNAPHFVHSFANGDFVYFFFRETAVEYINCGKNVFSRVARVCKNDRGGPQQLKNRWTSYLKSRLNCSVPGEFPFYFNEIQSATDLVQGNYGGKPYQMMYGVFTTPVNSISGSAVCAFSLADILDSFEGEFKEQKTINNNWLPVPGSKVPDPRPGQCANDSRTLPDLTLNFIKSHSLMDDAVRSFYQQPIIIRTSVNYRFTVIAVDPQVKAIDGKTYDVLFIGTDSGKVLKAINAASADSTEKVSPVVIEELYEFGGPGTTAAVRNIQLEGKRLLVVTDRQVVSLPLDRCQNTFISTCSECIGLQDPYCAWDKVNNKCRSMREITSSRWHEFYQNIQNGMHNECPGINRKDIFASNAQSGIIGKSFEDIGDANTINISQDDQAPSFGTNNDDVKVDERQEDGYTMETVLTAVFAACLAALLAGFIAGFACARRCTKSEDDNLPYPDTEYEYFEQRHNMNARLGEPKLLPQEEVTYAEPVLIPPNKVIHGSPKATLRHAPMPPMGFSQFQPNNTQESYYSQQQNIRDHFGTLRSQREHKNDGSNYRDGFGTTRSVKKVYL